MHRRHAALLLVGLAVTMSAGDSPRHDSPVGKTGATLGSITAGTALPASSVGQVIILDPTTAKIRGAATQPIDLAEILGDAVSTSAEGLVEEKSSVAGGGVLVNLQGRFQNAVTAVVDANGKLTVPCSSGGRDDARPRTGEVK